MTPKQQWQDTSYCFDNAVKLRKAGLPVCASIWQARAELLMERMCRPGRDLGGLFAKATKAYRMSA